MRKKHLVLNAIVILGLGALAIPATADAKGGGGHVRNLRLQDRCDPASFNAAIPSAPGAPPTCSEHSGQLITFADFLAKLNPVDFGHPKWNNHPDELDLKKGDSISATVRGGEFHTFTEVDAYGPGCVPFINEALGLAGPPASDCAAILVSGTAPGAPPVVVSGLAPGTHLFMCLIHPWMRTEVDVEDD